MEALIYRRPFIGAEPKWTQNFVNYPFGSFAYDGTLAEKDANRHKMYLTTQDHAKGNMFGVWSAE